MKTFILLLALALVVASFEYDDELEMEADMIVKRAYDDMVNVVKRGRKNKGKSAYCKCRQLNM